jgi:hypothetical protein
MSRRLQSMLLRAACALTLAGPAYADGFEWTAASGLTPDQTGGFSLVTQGDVQATLLPGGPLVLASFDTRFDLLTYRASGSQIQMHDAVVVEFTTRFVESVPLVEGSLRSPLMVSVSFGNHVGASLMITERFAAFNYGHDQQIAPGAQLDWYSLNHHRLEFSGTTTDGRVRHLINGEYRYSMPLQQSAVLFSADARIQFGDMTEQFGGTSEWLSFSHNAAPVPEPGSWALMLAGLAVVGGIARRRGGVAA